MCLQIHSRFCKDSLFEKKHKMSTFVKTVSDTSQHIWKYHRVELYLTLCFVFFILYYIYYKDELYSDYVGINRKKPKSKSKKTISAAQVSNSNRNFEQKDMGPNPFVRKSRPKCKKLHEKRCKEILEQIFGVPFVTIRPTWLRNPETGRCLEIDAFNHDLQLGAEYSGSQHTVYSQYWQQSYEDFFQLVARDKLKYDLCKAHGIDLLIIPHTVSFKNLEKYIREELRRMGRL